MVVCGGAARHLTPGEPGRERWGTDASASRSLSEAAATAGSRGGARAAAVSTWFCKIGRDVVAWARGLLLPTAATRGAGSTGEALHLLVLFPVGACDAAVAVPLPPGEMPLEEGHAGLPGGGRGHPSAGHVQRPMRPQHHDVKWCEV